MTTNLDTVFEWMAEGDSEYSSYLLRIHWITWDKAIVIFRSLSDNSGNKIANVAEKIVSLISHNYDLASNKIMLIEHYSTDNLPDEDIYLQVLLINNEPTRYVIEKSRLVELIGKSI